MKSFNNISLEVTSKQTKKENAPDTKSKSFKSKCLKSSGRLLILNILIMSTLRNHVQLIGNVGQEPQITNLEGGKKVARFSPATNEYYKNEQGEKVQNTEWHTVVAWGRTAEIIEKYAGKGKEIGVSGKLKSRSYEDDEGVKRYVTEVEANEILLLGAGNGHSTN